MQTKLAPYRVLLGWVCLLIMPPAALADSYPPFQSFRQVESTGRFYVVCKELPGGPEDPGRGTPVSFELAERKPGSKPVFDVADFWRDGEMVANPNVRVRQDDVIHGRGKLTRCPRKVLISATGLGFVGLDVRGYNYGDLQSGNAVVIVAKDGTIRRGLNLIDLFRKEEVERLEHTAGGVRWLGGGWIDDKRGEVVVVSTTWGIDGDRIERLIRIVNLKTGAVRPGTREEIVTALAEANVGAMEFALELAAELKLKHMALPAILDNEKFPQPARLRAAVALAASGDKRGAELLQQAALESSPGQAYAVRNLPIVLNGQAAATLCEVVRRHGAELSTVAWEAMLDVSPEFAVPELVRLLQDEASPVGQQFALECLTSIGPKAKAAVPELRKFLRERPKTPERIKSLVKEALLIIDT